MPPFLRQRRLAGLVGAAALLGVLAAGCGGPGAPAKIVVPKGGFANDKSDPATLKWFKQHLPAVTGLGTLSTLGPLTAPDYSALSAKCVSFGDTVGAAKKLPPIPNDNAETLWKDALAQFDAAVENCTNGVVHKSATLLNDASSDLTLAHSTLATLIFGPVSSKGGA